MDILGITLVCSLLQKMMHDEYVGWHTAFRGSLVVFDMYFNLFDAEILFPSFLNNKFL